MKKFFPVILVLSILLAGCSAAPQPTEAPAPQLQIGNPWKSYESMLEAETASGLDFPLPEQIGDVYAAESFRVMNASLMEVTYRDLNSDSKVTVRMQSGADDDISGVYEDPDSIEVLQINGASVTVKLKGQSCLYLISKDGYSFSLYAPNNFQGESADEFLSYIC